MNSKLFASLLKRKEYQYLENLFFSAPASTFIIFWLATLIVKSGIWVIPGIEVYRQISLSPFHPPQSSFLANEMVHYLFYSWLLPFTAWATNFTTPAKFILLCFLFSLAFLALAIFFLFKFLRSEEARKALLILFALPVGMTSLYWIGYDGLTLLLMLVGVVVVSKGSKLNYFGPLIIGALLGLQHFEQGLFGFLILVSYYFFGREPGDQIKRHNDILQRLALLIAGLAIGKLILWAIITMNQIPISAGRSAWVMVAWKGILKRFFLRSQIIIYSLLGVVWLFALAGIIVSRKRFYWLAIVLFLVGLSAIVEDQTRVVAVVSFPLIFTILLEGQSLLQCMSRPATLLLAALYLITPYAWVWTGIPQASSFPYAFYLLFKVSKGTHFEPWWSWFVWPFNLPQL